MALINCYECGKQISDAAQACPNCGAPVKAPEKKKFCKYCGVQIEAGTSFCPSCGKPLTAGAQVQYSPQQSAQPVSYQPQAQPFAAMGMQQPVFMPCALHPQSPAVASCGSLETSNSAFNVFVPLSSSLSSPEASLFTKSLSSYPSGDTGDGNGHIWGWIIAGFGGLPSALKTFFHRSEAEKAVADIHTRVDPENGCMQEIIWFILALVFSFVFAPIAAVWFIIKNTSKIISNTNFLNKERPLRDNLVLELQGE